jgi:NADH-quinone oxidoreductase subunit H
MLVIWSFIIYKAIMCVAVFAVALGIAAYSTWWERKFAGYLQDRYGPKRAGPWGLLQPLADGGKLFFKEEIIPNVSNKFLFILGPSLVMITALMTGAVIPWGRPLHLDNGDLFHLQITDLNIGVLYLLGVVSVGVYGIMIGGWASNNKYALLGAIRASSQMISYEVAMGLAVIALIISSGGSLSLNDIVTAQGDGGLANVCWQPLGFIIFFVCALAETNRAPFDLPECEAELVGGYHTEYSSMKLGLFLFAEYINMFISSAIMAGVYFGGYNLPEWIENFYRGSVSLDTFALIGMFAFFIKIFIFISVFMWIRWTIPRFRYDQLMNLGWKILIPLALLNLGVTALIQAWRDGLF